MDQNKPEPSPQPQQTPPAPQEVPDRKTGDPSPHQNPGEPIRPKG